MRQRIIPLVLLAAAAVTISCSAGKNPTGPSPLPEPNSTINYTAVAASDGNGIGSSVPCLPFAGLTDCPNGKGYVYVAASQLRAKGFMTNLTNLSVPTAPFVASNSTLITIFAGGNDVNVVTGALGAGEGASDQVGYINAQIKAFAADYTTLLNLLRTRAPSARIVVLNLPNMGAMPFLASAPLAQRQAAQKLSVGMTTTATNPLTAQNVLVIDMMCDARSYQASTYSSDGFHPSDAGYAWMAAEVVSAATTNYKSPQSSCSQMTLVP